jgi:TRAP-type C4-dicarboxylate transport system substrate-binding protein
MRVARRTFLASAAAAIVAPAVVRLARADTPITLKLHHFQSSVSSGHDKFLVPWARKVEAESGGRIRIDIFPSMQLGGTPARLFDQARDGVVDIAWTAPNLTPGRFPKIEMFELPFVPARRALVGSKALQDFAAINLNDEFREVHAISFSCTDRGVMHANQSVRTIEDVKDLKLHVLTRFTGEAMRMLGAHPVPMPVAQLPLAITQRIVDGCVDPWHVVPPLRLNDLLKTHTEFSDFSLSTTTYVLAMNKPVYDRLPRDLKAVIDNNSGQFAAGMAGAMWDVQAAAVADMVVQRGDVIITLLPDAVAHWRKATEPVVDIWLKEMREQKVDGGKLLASARALLVKYANEPEPQAPQAPAPQQETVTQPQPQPQSQPQAQPQAKADTSPMPKPAGPATSPLAPAPNPAPPSAPPAAATPAPAPPLAKPIPPSPPVAAAQPPAATPAPAVPVVKPVPTAPAVAATPPVPSLPPIPKPALVPPPKVLDIPL